MLSQAVLAVRLETTNTDAPCPKARESISTVVTGFLYYEYIDLFNLLQLECGHCEMTFEEL